MHLIPDPLHPAVVHFPIAVTLIAWALDVLATFRPMAALRPGATALWVVAVPAAVAALVTGLGAQDSAVIPPAAVPLVEQHRLFAWWSFGVLGALVAARLWLVRGKGLVGWRMGVWLLTSAAVTVMVLHTARLGGQLVFDHGVGTSPVQERRVTPRSVP